jgi:hypothetical protein
MDPSDIVGYLWLFIKVMTGLLLVLIVIAVIQRLSNDKTPKDFS